MKAAQLRLMSHLPDPQQVRAIECWWVAEDERYDGSDNESAIFIKHTDTQDDGVIYTYTVLKISDNFWFASGEITRGANGRRWIDIVNFFKDGLVEAWIVSEWEKL
jgi:hypothetical protein